MVYFRSVPLILFLSVWSGNGTTSASESCEVSCAEGYYGAECTGCNCQADEFCDDGREGSGQCRGAFQLATPSPGSPGFIEEDIGGAGVSNTGLVVFSTTGKYTSEDTDALDDVFLFNAKNGSVSWLSSGPQGANTNGSESAPKISGDGSRVTWLSYSTDLTVEEPAGAPVDTDTYLDVVVHTFATGHTTLVSDLPAALKPASNSLGAPFISEDGNVICSSSRRKMAGDISADAEGESDAYVFLLDSGNRVLASTGTGGNNATSFWGSNSFGCNLSSNGRYIGFTSPGHGLPTTSQNITVQNFHAYYKDLGEGLDLLSTDGTVATGTTVRLSNNYQSASVACNGAYQAEGSGVPIVSNDGRYAYFHSKCEAMTNAYNFNGKYQIVRRLMDTHQGVVMSRMNTNSSLAGDGDSYLQGITSDGRYVLYTSDATNIVENDTNGVRDVFLYDTVTFVATRISTDAFGNQLTGASDFAAISPNGQWVIFRTSATIQGDTDGTKSDIYIKKLF